MRTDLRLHTHLALSPRRPMVVVIDQDEDTCRILTLLFGAAGMTVVTAGDAATAAAALGGRHPAVVVSELRGRAAFAEFLLEGIAREPALRGAPLVVHTSRLWPSELAHLTISNAVALFAKPTGLGALLACVRMLATTASDPGGDHEREHAADAHRAFNVDPPAVPLGDAASDRQPQPGPCAA